MINWRKNKTKINLVIDAVMLLVLVAIAGLGFLIKYVLIPGYKRNALYPGDVELYFMGLTRHEWGRIHLLLGFIFLLLLLIHIILHWNTIGCIFRQMISGKALRRVIAVVLGVLCFIFLFIPLVMKPEVVSLPKKHIHSKTVTRLPDNNHDKLPGTEQAEKKEMLLKKDTHNGIPDSSHKHPHSEIEVYGYMTLSEAAIKHEVDVTELSNALSIPPSLADMRIGRLRRQYGFRNNEIRDAILKITRQSPANQ
jgi:hypothetical protein